MNARQNFEANSPRADQSLGAIAVQLPGATAIFRQLKLDFCCHGDVSLRQAAADKGLDLTALLTELAALKRSSALPSSLTPAALIDHIVSRFHDVHRAQLPELVRMARRVELVHRDSPDVPAGLADVLETLQNDMLEHMGNEENVLFPVLKSGVKGNYGQPLSQLRAEHTQHGELLERINTLTHDATPPEGACNTWRALYNGIQQFTDDLMNHIHMENNLLFPAFESAAKTGGCGGAGGCSCQ